MRSTFRFASPGAKLGPAEFHPARRPHRAFQPQARFVPDRLACSHAAGVAGTTIPTAHISRRRRYPARPPRSIHQMDAEAPELMPALWIAHVLWKENNHVTPSRPDVPPGFGKEDPVRWCSGPRTRSEIDAGCLPSSVPATPGASCARTQFSITASQEGIATRPLQKRSCQFPNPSRVVAEKPIQRQFLEGKNATVIEQG